MQSKFVRHPSVVCVSIISEPHAWISFKLLLVVVCLGHTLRTFLSFEKSMFSNFSRFSFSISVNMGPYGEKKIKMLLLSQIAFQQEWPLGQRKTLPTHKFSYAISRLLLPTDTCIYIMYCTDLLPFNIQVILTVGFQGHWIGFPIYAFPFMVNSNIYPTMPPSRDITLPNLSDLKFDLPRSPNVKCQCHWTPHAGYPVSV